ncbi:MAG TPA: ABC transporter permease [Xanthobacteraceae bacterium]
MTAIPVAAPATSFNAARVLASGHFALRRLAGPAIVVVLWHLASTRGWVDARFVPAPFTVLRALQQWMFGPVGANPYSGTWFAHAGNSAYRVIVGFLIAAATGVTIGCLIGWFRLVSDLVDPVIQVLRPIPITAWVPFAVIFFGIRDGSAFFLIALGAFFPIVVNTAAGVGSTPKLLVRAARMLGIRPYMLLPRVVLPSAMPFIFTGLRLGIGLAWVLVIVAEMMAVKSGLGFAMWDAYYFLRMDIIIAAMLSVGALGFLSDLVIRLIGRRFLRWSRGL